MISLSRKPQCLKNRHKCWNSWCALLLSSNSSSPSPGQWIQQYPPSLARSLKRSRSGIKFTDESCESSGGGCKAGWQSLPGFERRSGLVSLSFFLVFPYLQDDVIHWVHDDNRDVFMNVDNSSDGSRCRTMGDPALDRHSSGKFLRDPCKRTKTSLPLETRVELRRGSLYQNTHLSMINARRVTQTMFRMGSGRGPALKSKLLRLLYGGKTYLDDTSMSACFYYDVNSIILIFINWTYTNDRD
jgi:hypothetical protein